MTTLPTIQWEQLSQKEQKAILVRGTIDRSQQEKVAEILRRVQLEQDRGLRELAIQWDGLGQNQTLRVSFDEMKKAWDALPCPLKDAMEIAKRNIESFHQAQAPRSIITETISGLICEQRPVPIDRVGLYVPGGTAPLFSTLLMLALPAKLAGCQQLVVTSPGRSQVTLAAAFLCGVDEFYACGGAQAIAALTFGTESIARVDKIFGPGNSYVTEAKIQASQTVAVDMPAGPSEVLVIADSSASPEILAWDLLSQLEHDPEARAVLVSDSDSTLEQTKASLFNHLPQLSRKDFVNQSILSTLFIKTSSLKEAVQFSNQYAPEHLIINCIDCDKLSAQVTNAGSVFIGPYTPESFGDYASGTNHVLPTAGAARSHSGVSMQSFFKFITFQRASQKAAAELAPSVVTLAKAEGLECHARAAQIRMVGQ